MSGIFDQIINYSPPLIVSGTVNYKGTWNASTNNPTLNSSPAASTKGDYYVVSTAGTQFGITFAVGDWIISNGTVWEKVDLTDAVSSVFGRTGAVVGVSTDYSAVGLTNTAIGAANPSTGAFTSVAALSNSGYQAVVGQLTSGDRVGISGQASGSGATLVFFDNAQTTFRPAIFDASSHSLKISGVEKASVTSTGLQGAIGATTASTGAFTTVTATSITNGLGAVGTPSYTFTGDTNTGMWSPAADTIAFSEGGTEAMRINSSGNVGIGTASPAEKLSVNGNVAVTGALSATGGYNGSVGATTASTGAFTTLTSSSGITVTNDSGIIVRNNSTDALQKIGRLGTTHYTNAEEPFYGIVFNVLQTTSTLLLGGGTGLGNAATDIAFTTAANNTTTTGTERMRINSSGNVLINTVNDSSALLKLGDDANAYGTAKGMIFGTDTNLYRSAANTLKTDDNFVAAGGIDSTAIGATTPSTGAFTTLSATPGSGVSGLTVTGNAAGFFADFVATNLADSGIRIRNTGTGGRSYNLSAATDASGNIPGAGLYLYDSTGAKLVWSADTNSRFNVYNGLAVTGALSCTGALSKGSGSFRIEHPLPEKSATHQLVHSFIEGPRADLIYRGKVVLVDGKASVNIDTAATMTEGTFEVLCRDVQCFTTNESGWTAVRGKVTGNILTIEAKDADCVDEISWMVIGERKDPHIMDTDWTDENGRPIVEPLKPVEPALESN